MAYAATKILARHRVCDRPRNNWLSSRAAYVVSGTFDSRGPDARPDHRWSAQIFRYPICGTAVWNFSLVNPCTTQALVGRVAGNPVWPNMSADRSARDKENTVYPNGMIGFQAQVKAGEDHEFFVPEGGQFRVKCDPGEGKYFSYDELPDNGETRNFTCWGGFVNKPAGEAVVAAVVDAAEETGEFVVNVSTWDTRHQMNDTSWIMETETDELLETGLTPIS